MLRILETKTFGKRLVNLRSEYSQDPPADDSWSVAEAAGVKTDAEALRPSYDG